MGYCDTLLKIMALAKLLASLAFHLEELRHVAELAVTGVEEIAHRQSLKL